MPAHNKRYDWSKWLRPGKTVTLSRGTHFDCEPYSLAQQARNAARLLGVLVSIQRRGLPLGTLKMTTRDRRG